MYLVYLGVLRELYQVNYQVNCPPRLCFGDGWLIL